MSATITEKLTKIFFYYDKDTNDQLDNKECKQLFDDAIRLIPSMKYNTYDSFAQSFTVTDITNQEVVGQKYLHKSDFIQSIRDFQLLDENSINVLYDLVMKKTPTTPIPKKQAPSKRDYPSPPPPPPDQRSDWMKQGFDQINGLIDIGKKIEYDIVNQSQKDAVAKNINISIYPENLKNLMEAINEAKKEFEKFFFIQGQVVSFSKGETRRSAKIIDVIDFEYYKVEYTRSVTRENLSIFDGEIYIKRDVYKKGDTVRFDKDGESKDGIVLEVISEKEGDYFLSFKSNIHYTELSI